MMKLRAILKLIFSRKFFLYIDGKEVTNYTEWEISRSGQAIYIGGNKKKQ